MSNQNETIEQAELKAISDNLKVKIENLQKAIDEEKNPTQAKILQCELEIFKSIKQSAETNNRETHRNFVDLLMSKLDKLKNVADDDEDE